MKNNFFLGGTLVFIFGFLSLLLAGITPGTAQAQTLQIASHQCVISSIASVEVDRTDIPVENRIYVQCTNATGGISSFASALGTNAGNANRYLVMLNTAVALGKTVTVFYDINSTHNPLGCQPDCRKITGLVLGP
jgi:hypothetical protein